MVVGGEAANAIVPNRGIYYFQISPDLYGVADFRRYASMALLFCLFENQGQNLKKYNWQKAVIFYLPKTSKYLNMRGGDLVMFWYVVRIFSCRHYPHYPISRVNITQDYWGLMSLLRAINLSSCILRCQLVLWFILRGQGWWCNQRCELCESRTVTEAGWHRHSGPWAALCAHPTQLIRSESRAWYPVRRVAANQG